MRGLMFYSLVPGVSGASTSAISAGIVCWDILQSVGALFIVWWIGGRLWSFREPLMDEFHPSLPPFCRCHTHRPTCFVNIHRSARLRRPVVPDGDGDDVVDAFLDSELKWLQLQQFHWHCEWSLHEELFRWWMICLFSVPRALCQVFKLFVPLICLVPLHWLQCNTALLMVGWMHWSHQDIYFDCILDSDLLVDQLIWLIVVGRGTLAAGALLALCCIWIWHWRLSSSHFLRTSLNRALFIELLYDLLVDKMIHLKIWLQIWRTC
jgi:hypothetical protein